MEHLLRRIINKLFEPMRLKRLIENDDGDASEKAKRELCDYLLKKSPQILSLAIAYAEHYERYGIDITEKWKTAVEHVYNLHKAEMRGFTEARASIQPILYKDGMVDRYKCECGAHLYYTRHEHWDFCPSCGKALNWDGINEK